MHKRIEYSVWVWNKDTGRFFPLPQRLPSYDCAIDYHTAYEREWGNLHKHFDFNKFQIKKQTITYSAYEVLYG